MILDDIIPGTLLEIYIQRDGFNYKVISKIELVDGDTIAVSPIASKMRMFRFMNTDVVDVVYHTDDKTWKWTNVKPEIVVDEEGNKLHGFIVGKEAEVLNRRSTYRLEMNRSMTMKYLVKEEDIFLNESGLYTDSNPDRVIDEALRLLDTTKFRWEECDCFLKDVSEGGAALQSDTELKKGDEVWFEFPSPEGTVVCKAVVVRVKKDIHGYYDNHYGCSFTEISKNFTRFLFAQQRRELSARRGKENVRGDEDFSYGYEDEEN